MYSLVDDFTAFFRKHFARDGEPEEEEPSDTPVAGGEPYRPTPRPEPVGVRRRREDAGEGPMLPGGLSPSPDAT